MRRTSLIAVLVGLAAIAAASQDALARGRMYHPRLGRFLQRDPIGTPYAPPGTISAQPAATRNLSSPRFTQRDPEPARQYVDGMSLYQYVQSTPASGLDPWGLWKIERNGGSKATATAGEKRHVGWGRWKNDQISDLADAIGLEPTEFKKWLTLNASTIKAVAGNKNLATLTLTDKICPGEKAKVPNTVLAYWGGELGGFGKFWVMWDTDVNTLKRRGFSVPVNQGWTGNQLETYIQNTTRSKELHGMLFWGHGTRAGVLTDSGQKGKPAFNSRYANWNPAYRMGFGVLFACHTQAARARFSTARAAVFWGKTGILVPHGFHLFGPTVSSLLPSGAQGTSK